MKKLIFSLLVISFNAFASISIISDLDDTIKITNSGQEVEGGINAVFTDKVFTGISSFFKASRDYSHKTHILSASPLILRQKILRSFKKSEIEIESLTLKNGLIRQSKLDYKIKELKKHLEKSDDDFILIGDDVGQDPEAYDAIKKLYPNRILAIYIHAIQDRPIPETGSKYWTTFDLFVREYQSGRMGNSWVKDSAQVIEDEQKFNLIIPSFAKCPTTPERWLWQIRTPFFLESLQVTKKVNSRCLLRSSGI